MSVVIDQPTELHVDELMDRLQDYCEMKGVRLD